MPVGCHQPLEAFEATYECLPFGGRQIGKRLQTGSPQFPAQFGDICLGSRDEAEVAELRRNLRTACLEPFAELTPSKRQALIRRLEGLKRLMTADWHERPELSLMLILCA
ncbi:hypothetical protein MKK70_23380 [Methylobacterium sp. E-041]|uniref:hypothetical protein n=1 Tax=Methylobacterium sp. E-041 TaxID=2836573 RepID=UPI001FBA6046|nr:hypothetical protein [Methylobacterium sp. E-041]MCJ2108254.1 hypothetical protein [Methylobacterium sp. E-041]